MYKFIFCIKNYEIKEEKNRKKSKNLTYSVLRQVLLLIEGKVHAYVFASKGCKKWDTCAPEAVLHAVGGRLTDLLGKPITYGPQVRFPNASGVLATVANHDWYVSQIPDDIQEMFVPEPESQQQQQEQQKPLQPPPPAV